MPAARSPGPGVLAAAGVAAAALDGIGLAELEASAELLDRVDTKYLLSASRVPALIEDCSSGHRVLDVDGIRLPRYSTLYFDTRDLFFYAWHHAGRLSRHKVRIRTYLDSEKRFLEVKRKDNHRRTAKVRLPVDTTSTGELWRLRDPVFSDIAPATPVANLWPALRVDYRRVTLVSRDGAERVTFDLMLRVAREGRMAAFPALAIAEVKQRRSNASAFRSLMRRRYVREGGMSKYCLGIATLVAGVRTNNFKPAIHRVARQAGRP